MSSDGGKWIVIQRRINDSVDFYLNWTDYVNGFGDLEGEFWYGLENIHCLTTRENVELRIEINRVINPTLYDNPLAPITTHENVPGVNLY